MGEEKRTLRREHLIFYLRVFDMESERLLGNIVDITPKGLMLISEEKIEVAQVFQLKMDLPRTIFGKQIIQMEAESLWCKPDINPDFWGTGFRIIHIEDEDEKIIHRLISEFGFSAP